MGDAYVAYETADGEGNNAFTILVVEAGNEFHIIMRANHNTMQEKAVGDTPDWLSPEQLARIGIRLIEITSWWSERQWLEDLVKAELSDLGIIRAGERS